MKGKTPVNRLSNKLMTLLRLLVMAMLFGSAAIVAPLAASASGPHSSVYSLQDDGDDEETPEDEDEETPEDEDEETPDDEDVTPEEDDEETPEDDSGIDPDWADAGLISETEYESPQFGYTVEWDEPYILDTESDDEPVESETESTDESAAFDRVWLVSEEPLSFTAVYGYSYEEYGYEDDEEVAEDWVGYWTSDEYLENADLFGSDVAVLLDDEGPVSGGVVIYDTDGDGVPYIRYKEILISENGDSVIALDFSSYVDDLEDTLTAAQTAIEVDGENVYLTFDVDEIIDAVSDHESDSSTGDDEDAEETPDDEDAEETPDDEDVDEDPEDEENAPDDEETPEDEDEAAFAGRFAFSAPIWSSN